MVQGQDSRGRTLKHRAERRIQRSRSTARLTASGSSFRAQQFALVIEVASLLVEFVGHRSKNQAGALVVLAVGEIATMVGMEPKLLCGAAHQD
jgi:hypothetical protein